MAQNDKLHCDVLKIEYDFEARAGRLLMAEENCCDMGGCIGLFEGIDSHVMLIETFSGDEADTLYRRSKAGDWNAHG